MIVGTGIVDLLIADSRSLKEKRSVLSRILKRTQNHFNVAIAEIGDQELWGRAKVGFCVVGNDRRYINGKLDMILRFMRDMYLAEVIHTRIEILNLSDRMEEGTFEDGKYDIV
jgi:uncharacterized protein YlxP (DUF503 family)